MKTKVVEDIASLMDVAIADKVPLRPKLAVDSLLIVLLFLIVPMFAPVAFVLVAFPLFGLIFLILMIAFFAYVRISLLENTSDDEKSWLRLD